MTLGSLVDTLNFGTLIKVIYSEHNGSFIETEVIFEGQVINIEDSELFYDYIDHEPYDIKINIDVLEIRL